MSTEKKNLTHKKGIIIYIDFKRRCEEDDDDDDNNNSIWYNKTEMVKNIASIYTYKAFLNWYYQFK